jgi:hypothetical protein
MMEDSQLVVSHIGDLATTAAATPYMQKLEEAALEGKTVLHFADQFPGVERNNYTGSMPWTDGRGNISFMCNDLAITKMVKEWADGQKHMAPMSIGDIGRKEFTDLIIDKLQPTTVEERVCSAFPAEAEEEAMLEGQAQSFDTVEDDEDIGNERDEILQHEQTLLEEMPLPGTEKGEAERRQKWLKLPRPARAAIRRMHLQFGHLPKQPLYELLKAAKCPPEYLEASKYFKCDTCSRTQHLPKQTQKVSPPKPYIFNDRVGIDVDYIMDYDGKTVMLLNIVDLGTGFQIQCPLRLGHGTPKSIECLDAYMMYWVSWAGYPKMLVTDRGLNNRGVFRKELEAAGVDCTNIGLEAPYQLGKVERHGGIWKTVATKVIDAKQISGWNSMCRMAH